MGHSNGNILTWYHLVLLFLVTLPLLNFPQVEGRRILKDVEGPHFEYAMVGTLQSPGKRLYGGKASISVWDPYVSTVKDFSSSSMIVSLSDDAFLEVGWIVYPQLNGDTQPRLFVYWTTDDSVNTGCFDQHCDGFLLFDESSPIGSPIVPVSTLGAAKYSYIDVLIFQDRSTGNWHLNVQGTPIGYWPASLFTGLPSGAESLAWGGTVKDSVGNGTHTATNMGNGRFPDPATGFASTVCSLQYVDSSNTLVAPDRDMLGLYVTNPSCYDTQLVGVTQDDGVCFLFGGPGLNPRCP